MALIKPRTHHVKKSLKHNTKNLLMVFISLIILLATILNAHALELYKNQSFISTLPNEYDDNVFIISQDVLMNYTSVDGDLVAVSIIQNINSRETKNAMFISVQQNISGNFNGNVYIVSGSTLLNAHITGDLIIFSGNVIISENTTIDGDVLIYSNTFKNSGLIKGSLKVYSYETKLNGSIKTNAFIASDIIKFNSNAFIQGNLSYITSKKLKLNKSHVAGRIYYKKITAKPFTQQLKTKLLFSLMFIVMGTFLLFLFPKFFENSNFIMIRNISEVALLGFLSLAILPFVLFILILSVIGIPLATIILFYYITSLLVSGVIVGYFIGGYISYAIFKGNLSRYSALMLGIMLLFALSLFNSLNALIILITIILGHGIIAVNVKNYVLKHRINRKTSKKKQKKIILTDPNKKQEYIYKFP